jgi:CRISPR system Cascade subunit CasA
MNCFNLVDEKWIPVADYSLASLNEIFSRFDLRALGGNPIQKISIIKLLLAIAQAAYTPKDDDDWKRLGKNGIAEKSLEYLKREKDCFWLYGEKPFLQMPLVINARLQSLGAVSDGIVTGNTTVLFQSQVEHKLTDAEKAQLVVELGNFAFGGKKTDKLIILSNDCIKKTGKPGPALGYNGFLHSFLIGSSIFETLWLNMLTEEQIKEIPFAIKGLGIPPWEKMPIGEDCARAKELKETYLGRLVPLSRFFLLENDNLHYTEGIIYQNYLTGSFDISTAINFSGEKSRALWVNTEKKPWRELTSLLAFLTSQKKDFFDCYQLRLGLDRAKKTEMKSISIWSGGLRVSGNSGEQYCSGSDDFVESEFSLEMSCLNLPWFQRFKKEMEIIEELAKDVYKCTLGFLKQQNSANKSQAGRASNLFWQLAEHSFQKLIKSCNDKTFMMIRPIFMKEAQRAYDIFCYNETARQLDAWAANKPRLGKYLKEDTEFDKKSNHKEPINGKHDNTES